MRLAPEGSALARLTMVALGGFGLILFASARLRPQALLDAARCPLRETFGLPCPTCGGTHALVALAAGHPGQAIQASPLVAGGALGAAALAAYAAAATLVPAWRRTLATSPRERRTARILATLAVLLGWTYLLAGGGR